MKKSTLTIVILIVIVIILGLVLLFDIGRTQPPSYASIINFDDCVAAGYPVLESFPEQCKTPDGRTFVGTSTPQTTPVATTTPIGTGTTTATTTMIKVTSPLPHAAIKSPITIKGTAVGSWYFEAQFPVEITDNNGKILGQAGAMAQGDWMTTNFVPFQATVSFTVPPTATSGMIVLKKDNPSGDPARDMSLTIPITFSH